MNLYNTLNHFLFLLFINLLDILLNIYINYCFFRKFYNKNNEINLIIKLTPLKNKI